MSTFELILAGWAIVVSAALAYQLKFKDRGSAIFVCPSRSMQLAMVRLCEDNGVKPLFPLDARGVIQRAFMANGWIFNHVLDARLLERMGNPRAAFALVVKSPLTSAGQAMALLRQQGLHDIELLTDIDPGIPSHKLVGVKFREGEARFCIIFRLHFMKMGDGGMPPAWDWAKIERS